MKQPIADIVDRYTILLLKHADGLDVADELAEYQAASAGVDKNLCVELGFINAAMWKLEDQITNATTVTEVGTYYLKLRKLTLRRVAAKNKISEAFGEHLEKKNYG